MTRYTVFVTIPEFYVEAEVECSSKPTEDDILQALHCEASIEGDALPDHIELVHCYDGGVDSEVVVTIEPTDDRDSRDALLEQYDQQEEARQALLDCVGGHDDD